MVEIVVAFLEMKNWDLNATDVVGNTPFLWAIIKGHWAIMEIRLAWEDVVSDTGIDKVERLSPEQLGFVMKTS